MRLSFIPLPSSVCLRFKNYLQTFHFRDQDKTIKSVGITGLKKEIFVRDVGIEVPNLETLCIAVSSSLGASYFA